MNRLAVVLLVLVALINLAPLVGVLSAARLEALYAIPIADPSLEIAMRHRAVTIAIVGGLLLAAAFLPGLRPAAFVAGLVSMLAFVVLAFGVGGANASLLRVAWVDVGASVLLSLAWMADRAIDPAFGD